MKLMDGEKIVREYHIALGSHPEGHKLQQADGKNPEGDYTLDYVNENSKYYRSMHISYPNNKDRSTAKSVGLNPGGDIMIHGQKNGTGAAAWITQRVNWNQGCIAITNSEMDEFLELVPVGTPIHISW
ncbi:L,D-transpeptidase family protein [Halioglobus maricola]|nr:L,D-transpeptidase family protein [Halioglobus maricola]